MPVISKVTSSLIKSLITSTSYYVLGAVNILPAEFLARYTPTFKMFRNGNTISTDWTPEMSRPLGKVSHIRKEGNDTTGDGTKLNPYRTLEKARSVNTVIYRIGPGHWNRADGFASANWAPTISQIFIAEDGVGTVTLSRGYDNLTWVQQSAPNDNVYVATLPAPQTIEYCVDMNAPKQAGLYLADGVSLAPIPMTTQTSIVNCQANPNSMYLSAGNLAVRTFDGRAPDFNVIPLSQEGFMWFTFGSSNVFGYEGINAFGRRFARTEHATDNNNTYYQYNYANYYTTESQMAPVRIQGTKNNYVKNTNYGYVPAADVCSLALGNTITQVGIPNALFENVNCNGNGAAGPNNFNSFTGHYNSNCIILNCTGKNSYGPMYAFVLGAFVFIWGCSGDTSLASAGSSAQRSIYQIGGVNDVDLVTYSKMWVGYSSAAGVNYSRATTGGATLFNMGGFVDTTTLGDYTGSNIINY